MSRTLQEWVTDHLLLLYLVNLASRRYRIFETRTQKIVFLSEREAQEKQIGGLDYAFIKFNHGPFSSEIRGDINHLQQVQLVKKDRLGFSLKPDGSHFIRRNEEIFERNPKIINIISEYAEVVMDDEFEAMLTKVYSLPNPLKPHITIAETRHKDYLLSREVRRKITNPFQITEVELESYEVLLDPELFKRFLQSEKSVRTHPSISY